MGVGVGVGVGMGVGLGIRDIRDQGSGQRDGSSALRASLLARLLLCTSFHHLSSFLPQKVMGSSLKKAKKIKFNFVSFALSIKGSVRILDGSESIRY